MSRKESELTGDLINLWANKIPSNKTVEIFRLRYFGLRNTRARIIWFAIAIYANT